MRPRSTISSNESIPRHLSWALYLWYWEFIGIIKQSTWTAHRIELSEVFQFSFGMLCLFAWFLQGCSLARVRKASARRHIVAHCTITSIREVARHPYSVINSALSVWLEKNKVSLGVYKRQDKRYKVENISLLFIALVDQTSSDTFTMELARWHFLFNNHVTCSPNKSNHAWTLHNDVDKCRFIKSH